MNTNCYISKHFLAFSFVAFATNSNVRPLISAIFSQTCLTCIGSFLFPLYGTGVRYGLSVSISSLSSGTTSTVSTVFLALFTSNILAASFEEFMVFPGEEVHSKSLEDYANMWWQWTYTMPKEVSPVRDNTGENCHVGQKGDVWFLAGGYGTSKISRECVIPEGKHIFFPVINMVYYPRQNWMSEE